MTMDQFLAELTALLDKYNAEIYWDCDDCSDRHGIVGEHMCIEVDGRKQVLEFSECIDKHNVIDFVEKRKGT